MKITLVYTQDGRGIASKAAEKLSEKQEYMVKHYPCLPEQGPDLFWQVFAQCALDTDVVLFLLTNEEMILRAKEICGDDECRYDEAKAKYKVVWIDEKGIPEELKCGMVIKYNDCNNCKIGEPMSAGHADVPVAEGAAAETPLNTNGNKIQANEQNWLVELTEYIETIQHRLMMEIEYARLVQSGASYEQRLDSDIEKKTQKILKVWEQEISESVLARIDNSLRKEIEKIVNDNILEIVGEVLKDIENKTEQSFERHKQQSAEDTKDQIDKAIQNNNVSMEHIVINNAKKVINDAIRAANDVKKTIEQASEETQKAETLTAKQVWSILLLAFMGILLYISIVCDKMIFSSSMNLGISITIAVCGTVLIVASLCLCTAYRKESTRKNQYFQSLLEQRHYQACIETIDKITDKTKQEAMYEELIKLRLRNGPHNKQEDQNDD